MEIPRDRRRARPPAPLPVRRAVRDIGEHLTNWRRLRGLTAAEVSERAGIALSTLSAIESGKGGVSLENVLRVARVLGILDQVAEVVDPFNSDIGRLRAGEQLPRRVRRPRPPGRDEA